MLFSVELHWSKLARDLIAGTTIGIPETVAATCIRPTLFDSVVGVVRGIVTGLRWAMIGARYIVLAGFFPALSWSRKLLLVFFKISFDAFKLSLEFSDLLQRRWTARG